MAVLDSGARREFATGAVRDISEGKGRCDLLPLKQVDEFLNSFPEEPIDSDILIRIDQALKSKSDENAKYYIYLAMRNFIALHCKANTYDMVLEISKHFEDGALKYGDNNWQKGIPMHCYIDSGVRHYLKFVSGWTDERHDRAFLWNMLCLCWTIDNKPELNDCFYHWNVIPEYESVFRNYVTAPTVGSSAAIFGSSPVISAVEKLCSLKPEELKQFEDSLGGEPEETVKPKKKGAKRYSIEEKLAYIKRIENGESIHHIHITDKVSETALFRWKQRYDLGGVKGLRNNLRYTELRRLAKENDNEL